MVQTKTTSSVDWNLLAWISIALEAKNLNYRPSFKLIFTNRMLWPFKKQKNDNSIATSELFPETCPYSVYRKDRNLHGGVMLLVHKDIQHMPITELETTRSQFGLRCLQTNENQKWDPLRAMKTFIRRKVGHTT